MCFDKSWAAFIKLSRLSAKSSIKKANDFFQHLPLENLESHTRLQVVRVGLTNGATDAGFAEVLGTCAKLALATLKMSNSVSTATRAGRLMSQWKSKQKRGKKLRNSFYLTWEIALSGDNSFEFCLIRMWLWAQSLQAVCLLK